MNIIKLKLIYIIIKKVKAVFITPYYNYKEQPLSKQLILQYS